MQRVETSKKLVETNGKRVETSEKTLITISKRWYSDGGVSDRSSCIFSLFHRALARNDHISCFHAKLILISRLPVSTRFLLVSSSFLPVSSSFLPVSTRFYSFHYSSFILVSTRCTIN